MRLPDLVDIELARGIGLAFCRTSPRWVGHLVARAMAWALIRWSPEMHQTLERNLYHALGGSASDVEVRAMARRAMGHFARASFDFYSTAPKSRAAILAAVDVPSAGVARIQRELARGQGVLVLFPHISNFDLAGMALAATGLPLHVLSLSNPSAVLQEQNRLREVGGMRVTPITPESMRDAIRKMREGGITFSALDWPVPRECDLVEFFGRPSYLPLGPARMAQISGATVFVASCRFEAGDGYTFDIIGPVEMARGEDRRKGILANARTLAAILEELVRAHPEQWLMFHRVWPEGRPPLEHLRTGTKAQPDCGAQDRPAAKRLLGRIGE